MQRMIVEQSKELEEVKDEFGNASNLMQEKYMRLNESFSELQELYEGRPSRPEDLDMIRDQNEQIEQKDLFIKKQEDDMKFYKLELINREQSYNQMFGTNPTVGGAFNPVIGGMGGMAIGPKPQGQKTQKQLGMMMNANMQSKKVL